MYIYFSELLMKSSKRPVSPRIAKTSNNMPFQIAKMKSTLKPNPEESSNKLTKLADTVNTFDGNLSFNEEDAARDHLNNTLPT